MKKILIIDDEMISLRMTEHILATQYQTICAQSGEEALEIYRREHPDMILSDLHMPEMTGFELLSKLRDLYAEQIPFMFMTADKSDEVESRGFEGGAVDFIRKPFRADVLLKRVEKILLHADEVRGLMRAAQTDPMTGLLNKASSQTEISRICRESAGTIMMIDLDSFKLVNDLYGHDMGDKVLIRFAEIIQSAIRSNDIAGRMGGDEFIAFCQNVQDEHVIAQKAQSINEELIRSAKEFMGEDMTIPLGASIGAVLVPEEGTDFLELYRKADKALYEVKQNGKHGYAVYHEESAEGGTEETETSADIEEEMMILGERIRSKGAFRLNPEQFKLLYRFLVRMDANYQKTDRFIIFSLNAGNGDPIPNEAAEKLYEVVCGSLRQSDVVAPRGRGQIMLLLLEAGDMDARIVIERIKGNWEKEQSGYELTWEMRMIKAG